MHHLYENSGHVRTYGNPEYCVALIHGGPGAPGEMQPVCQKLAARGINLFEPLQTASSIASQINELCTQIESYANDPICLVGYSWGAMLALLTAAKYPHLARKVILVSSAVFEEKYVSSIMEKRFQRLCPHEEEELKELVQTLSKGPPTNSIEKAPHRFHELLCKADNFDPIIPENTTQEFQPDIYKSVWTEDVLNSIKKGCSPIILTERNEHLTTLAHMLRPKVKNLIVLRGKMTRKEIDETTEQLETII